MATKARSGSTRTPRSTSKTARSTATTKKSSPKKAATRTTKTASTTRRKSTARPAVRASAKRQSLKSKPFAIAHRHLIGGMAVLAVVVTGLVGYMATSSDNVAHSATATVSATGPIKGIAGKCLDNQSARVANGNKIQTYTCNNTVAQKWSVYSDNTLRVQGYCLDVKSASKTAGTIVQLYQCNGTVAQKWSLNNDGTIVNPNSGLCLDVRYGNTADGAVIQTYTCNGTSAQKWAAPTTSSVAPAPTPTSPTPTPSTPISTPPSTLSPHTGGSGGPLTNQTFQTFSANGYTSRYHLYAAGLDWSRPVGAMIYGDGSGEYGLKNPTSSYLLSGSNGLVAVAKKHNMILITPFSPNTACSDGDGSCWYMGDSVGYTKWAESLVQSIYKKYPIHKNRVAMGGYSSGAQLATQWWIPSGAAQRTMTDGVVVAISYGGAPRVSQTASSSFKSSVHVNWNTGSADEAYTTSGSYGVKGGYNAYRNAGFNTSLDVISGLGHGRSGQFGGVMDAQIREHVAPSQGSVSATPNPVTAPAPAPAPTPEPTSPSPSGKLISHTVKPTTYGAQLTAKVSTDVEKVLFRVSKYSFGTHTGYYTYGYPDANGNIYLSINSSLASGSKYYYAVELDDVRVKSGSSASGTFTTTRSYSWWW